MYLDNQQLLAILFELFFSPIFFFCYLFLVLFIVFLPYFLDVQTYNFHLFYLDLLYLDKQQFLVILFDWFLCQIFFEVLILFDGLVSFKIFWNISFKKYGFRALFLLIVVVRFSFLKCLESIFFLKKRPSPAGIFFFFSFFVGTNL